MRGNANGNRWQLTQEALQCLLRALGSDEERAVARFERLRGRLQLFFMRQSFVLPDELADRVVDRLACKLAEGLTVESIEAFALGMARMVAKEERASQLRQGRHDCELRGNISRGEGTSIENELALQALDAELEALPYAARVLLMTYHEGRGASRIGARRSLAQQMGISVGALRKRVFDLQARLARRLRDALDESSKNPRDREKDYLQP